MCRVYKEDMQLWTRGHLQSSEFRCGLFHWTKQDKYDLSRNWNGVCVGCTVKSMRDERRYQSPDWWVGWVVWSLKEKATTYHCNCCLHLLVQGIQLWLMVLSDLITKFTHLDSMYVCPHLKTLKTQTMCHPWHMLWDESLVSSPTKHYTSWVHRIAHPHLESRS